MGKTWSGFHPVVKTILIGTVFTGIGSGMIVPYFAIYLAEYTSLSISQIGFFIGAGSLAAMFGGFLGGTLSDLFGRRTVMIASLLLSGFILLGFTFKSFSVMLILLTIMKGFTYSFFDPSSKALISDLTDSGQRLGAFSMKYFCGNLGFAIGPLIGTVFGLNGTSTAPFYIAFIIFFSYSIILNSLLIRFNINTVSCKEEKVTFQASIKAMAKDKVLLSFLIGGLLATTVHGQFSATLSQYFYKDYKQGLQFLGILWSFHSLVIISLTVPISRLMEAKTPLRSIVVGTLLFAFGIIGFGLSSSLPALLLSMFVFTIGEIFLIPAEYAIIDEITPEQIRGTYYGAANLTALGSFVGPGLSGLLLLKFDSTIMFSFLTLTALASLIFYFWGIRLKDSMAAISIKQMRMNQNKDF
ncbi:MFS transporter [Bacillus sp. T33-2]|uniref:MFS transporter n=1 Tax=Bacillus sp. T33-2 TaxID=2054168 RepID=UPI000C76AB36|nr:MFS transporter [Bacillus sp. T33-2]PLR89862.1 MFS transporter [Bacillus sp. T33-2]